MYWRFVCSFNASFVGRCICIWADIYQRFSLCSKSWVLVVLTNTYVKENYRILYVVFRFSLLCKHFHWNTLISLHFKKWKYYFKIIFKLLVFEFISVYTLCLYSIMFFVLYFLLNGIIYFKFLYNFNHHFCTNLKSFWKYEGKSTFK